MVFRIAAIKPGVTKPPREEPQVLVLRQIAGDVARYVVQQSCTAEFRSSKIFPVSGACINRIKDLVTTRSDLFLEIGRDDRERLFKSHAPRKAIRITDEKNSTGREEGQCSFFRGTGRRLLVLQHRYRGGECPKAAKGGCCFLGTGRSPGRTGSGDCVVISLHLRLFGPTSGRRKGEKRSESAGDGAYRTSGKRRKWYREKERNIIVVRASVGARCPIRAHSGWLCGSHIGERECGEGERSGHQQHEDHLFLVLVLESPRTIAPVDIRGSNLRLIQGPCRSPFQLVADFSEPPARLTIRLADLVVTE
ncbi:hypothetical protein ALC60_12605 [Trachymyrmex zeteki]|uniref:Uncharacterized protein n=1 Tax=Mycetomoellerius zeteki TaxID=64791 RepID=A0A151WKE5_9HYME|nr:hypothetical protein ALC60_12605 [Trachymyrmex zeteki]